MGLRAGKDLRVARRRGASVHPVGLHKDPCSPSALESNAGGTAAPLKTSPSAPPPMKTSLPLRISVGLAACIASSGLARDASAADTMNRGKGVAGGVLLGAETVCLTEAAFGLQPTWLYGVGALAGAGGGVWVGYHLASSGSAKPSSFLLAGGIALVIPTLIGIITATHFQPPETYREEQQPEDEPAIEGRLEMPTLSFSQAFSQQEIAEFGLTQVTEIHVSLLRGVF